MNSLSDFITKSTPFGTVISRKKSFFNKEVNEIKDDEIELTNILGANELKSIGEQIAEIVRQHDLQKSPDTCRKLFNHLSDVIDGWNTGQEVKTTNSAKEVITEKLAQICFAIIDIYAQLQRLDCGHKITGPQCGRDKNGTFRCVCGRCRRLHKEVST